MRTAIPRYRRWSGHSLLARGFRPFFLAAGLSAWLLLLAWLAAVQGLLTIPSAFAGPLWHAHEMLFGFILAAVAGFLMTAIPNWTGRMPLQGAPLAALAALWLAGRAAVATSALIGAGPAAAVDLAFPVALFLLVLREIVAGRNWRNLPMVAAPFLLSVADGLMHAEPLGLADTATAGWRLGIGVMVMMIGLIGGRIVPSFTRNWLAKRGATSLPPSFGTLDRVALAASGLWALAWTIAPDGWSAAGLAAVAGLAHLLRLARWRAPATLGEPLVAGLHLAYLWVPVGLLLLAAAALLPAVPQTAGVHALAGGAMANMILAVMTRATLGHTGRSLSAGTATTAIYLFGFAAAASRVAAALVPAGWGLLIALAGLFWLLAFGLFLAVYGPMLWGRQVDGAPA